MLVDTHCHIYKEYYDDIDNILFKMKQNGVDKIINNGCDFNTSLEVLELSKNCDNMFCAIGIHPDEIGDSFDNFVILFLSNLENKKLVAIGEIGLDYYWNKENKRNQKSAFIKQIEIANELDLPIVIHTREAIADTIDILKNQITVVNKGVFHCCPLNLDLIREGLKLGFYISFAGPITFKNSKNATEAISLVPLDRILVETDSPYLAPEPKRGTRNDSSNLIYTLQKIADVKQMSMEEVAKITYENTKNILKINTN